MPKRRTEPQYHSSRHRLSVKITPEIQAQLAEHAQKWIANAMRTNAVDPARVNASVRALYRAAKLEEPKVVVVVPSPFVGACAQAIATVWWHLRKQGNPAATDAATSAATRAATATDAATRAATSAATSAATRAATSDAGARWLCQLAQQFVGDFWQCAIKGAQQWGGPVSCGNMWSAWPCFLSAIRDIMGLRIPQWEVFASWEANTWDCGGFRWLHPDFAMVSDHPEILKVDELGRPHCDDGPSHRWRDGWSLYHIHGVAVPAHVVERPDTITVDEIDGTENAEVRRIMIDRYGVGRYLQDTGATIAHMDASHGLPRALMKTRHGDAYLYGSDNSTGRIYAMPVNPDATTCREAHQGICGFDESTIQHQS